MSKSLVSIDVDLTLMVMDANGDYQPSGVMTFQYYVAADEAFLADSGANSSKLMTEIYADHRRILSEQQPDDPNYIAVVGATPRIIDPSQYGSQPWLNGTCPAWEDSNLIGVHAEGYNKLSQPLFARLLVSGL